MAGVVEVCVGWLLGIGSSYIFRLYDRREKTRNFINGLEAELFEILPQSVGSVCLIKNDLGQFDYELLKWVDSVSLKLQKTFFPHQDIWLKDLLRQAPDELLTISKVKASQGTGSSLTLKTFSIKYIEHNIDTLPLIDKNYQKILIEIISKVNIINQAIEQYYFYFEKTFDPQSCNVNQQILTANIKNSYVMISNFLIKTIDKIVILLLMINDRKKNEPLYHLRNIISVITKKFFERK